MPHLVPASLKETIKIPHIDVLISALFWWGHFYTPSDPQHYSIFLRAQHGIQPLRSHKASQSAFYGSCSPTGQAPIHLRLLRRRGRLGLIRDLHPRLQALALVQRRWIRHNHLDRHPAATLLWARLAQPRSLRWVTHHQWKLARTDDYRETNKTGTPGKR